MKSILGNIKSLREIKLIIFLGEILSVWYCVEMVVDIIVVINKNINKFEFEVYIKLKNFCF